MFDFNPQPPGTWSYSYYDQLRTDLTVGRGFSISIPFARCPSAVSPSWARDYFGVQGGVNRAFPNRINRGDLHSDGMFGTHQLRKFGEIPDGTSNTMAIGENYLAITTGAIVNTAGNNLTTHNNTATAPEGYAPWWWGGGGGPYNQMPGLCANPPRHILTTNSAINDPRYRLGGTNHNVLSGAHGHPFSSLHTGIANFGFCDGHVQSLSQNVDILIYRSLASINGGEVTSVE